MLSKEIPAVHTHLASWVTEQFIIVAPAQAARALQKLATHEAVLLLKPLKASYVVTCVNEMEAVKAAALLRRLPVRQTLHILAHMHLPHAAAVYQAFSGPYQTKIKELLEPEFLHTLQQALSWPAASAGANMKREFVCFRTETKVSEMLEKLKTWPRKRLPTVCLVVTKEGIYKGLIRTAELVFCSPGSVAGSVMQPAPAVPAGNPAQEAAVLLRQGQEMVPVLDEQERLVGVLDWSTLAVAQKPKKRFGWF